MANPKLRGVLEELGFANVSSVITTGNLIFEADSGDATGLETRIEAAWPVNLGFHSTTLVRTQADFLEMVGSRPFGDIADEPQSRLEATFLKREPEGTDVLPYTPEDGGYTVLGAGDRVLFSVVDSTLSRTPDIMRWIERRFGKEITTRAWTTVLRIADRLERAEST